MLSPEEIRRRLRIYNEGGEVKDMAKKAGVKRATFASWLWDSGLPAHRVGYGKPSKCQPKKRKSEPQLQGIKGDPYVQDRPLKERLEMRKFVSKLIETYKRGQGRYKPNVRHFINEYRRLYGGVVSDDTGAEVKQELRT